MEFNMKKLNMLTHEVFLLKNYLEDQIILAECNHIEHKGKTNKDLEIENITKEVREIEIKETKGEINKEHTIPESNLDLELDKSNSGKSDRHRKKGKSQIDMEEANIDNKK